MSAKEPPGFLGWLSQLFQIFASLWLAAAMMSPISIVGWQIYEWARFGYWPPVTLYAFWEDIHRAPPSSSWVGIQHMLEWWLSSSLAFWLCIGLLIPAAVLAAISAWCRTAAEQMAQRRLDNAWERQMARRPPDPAD